MFSRIQVISSVFFVVAGLALAAAQTAPVQVSTWKRLSPGTSPEARVYPAMAFDPVSNKVILFGGLGVNGDLNDTWAFDGTNWTLIETAVAPPARNGATMAFDRGTRKLVMFGGFDVDQYLQDTWVWDGATATWTEAQMQVPPPKATGAMLFTDPVSGKAMMFGGYNSANTIPVYSTTWRWTGSSWLKLHPATVPYPKAWGIASLDPLRRNVVVTGGTGDTIRSDNTWTWDGNDWTLLSPTTQIPAYLGAGATFDPAAQSVVVFGANADTWSWTGNDWVQLTPNQSPLARAAIGMAYDFASHQAIIFGGELSTGPLANGTWQFIAH